VPLGGKKQRKEYVLRRARELAESGKFERWQGINFQLVLIEGLPEADDCLRSEEIREQLNFLCQQAKSRSSVIGAGGGRYTLVVSRPEPHSPWEWEIYCNGRSLPARLRVGGFKSEGAARAAGRLGLLRFLAALARKQNG
jgi:hypothetical protein